MVELMSMSDEHVESLRRAVKQLEFPTFADKATSLVGKPVEMTMKALPGKYQRRISAFVHRAIDRCFDWVLLTVDTSKQTTTSSDMAHKFVATGMGAVTGFVGGAAFLAELPLTTGVLLRTIADIARSEGEDLSTLDARLACVGVFALDTTSVRGDHSGLSAYRMVRQSLSNLVADASTQLAQGMAQAAAAQTMTAVSAQASAEVAATVTPNIASAESAPVLVRLINEIAARFGVTVSERVAAGIIPVIGAVGGAAVNFAFTDHFQRIAHGHFIVRRLERIYGRGLVADEYEKIRTELRSQRK
ncbi:EcsC family protein [Alicyclobacillus dauci]|uniref:EcsC family protein n=1 Tax=Alicyclobacillus dauci TaxID=1475485 RepID=A0ABY6ZAA4_9BACL|nr:EcsC family protein [Alicyclobacillus dauci]WAH39086.1 EcsC family protein [Alicyclobacillus dauci]